MSSDHPCADPDGILRDGASREIFYRGRVTKSESPQALFDSLNQHLFSGELPNPEIRIVDGLDVAGRLDWETGPSVISLAADVWREPYETVREVLVHEMCHLYARAILGDRSEDAHGELWRREAARVGCSVGSSPDDITPDHVRSLIAREMTVRDRDGLIEIVAEDGSILGSGDPPWIAIRSALVFLVAIKAERDELKAREAKILGATEDAIAELISQRDQRIDPDVYALAVMNGYRWEWIAHNGMPNDMRRVHEAWLNSVIRESLADIVGLEVLAKVEL